MSACSETLRESPSARVFCAPGMCLAFHAKSKSPAKNCSVRSKGISVASLLEPERTAATTTVLSDSSNTGAPD